MNIDSCCNSHHSGTQTQGRVVSNNCVLGTFFFYFVQILFRLNSGIIFNCLKKLVCIRQSKDDVYIVQRDRGSVGWSVDFGHVSSKTSQVEVPAHPILLISTIYLGLYVSSSTLKIWSGFYRLPVFIRI